MKHERAHLGKCHHQQRPTINMDFGESSSTGTVTDSFGWRRTIPSATIGNKHLSEYKAATQIWDEERYDECIAAAKSLLEKNDLPANLHMRALMMLATVTLDWESAEDCPLKCETLWHLTRKRYRGHPHEKVHATLQSLRESLNELCKRREEEALEREFREVALGHQFWRDSNSACEDMVDTRPESPIFKDNKLVRRM